MLKLTNHIIPASKIRKTFGTNNSRLRLSVNCYERDIKQNDEGINMIFAHAGGFHKEIWEPVIKSLFDRNSLNLAKVFAFDCYNHGDSAVLNENALPDTLKWWDLAYDILQVIDYARIKKPLVGVGHSIGGATMVMAELIKPGTFSSIVCVDPVLSPYIIKAGSSFNVSFILKRRDLWPNREVAKTSLRKHPALRNWDPEVLDIYTEYGLRELPTGQVTLKCSKLQEFYTFTHEFYASIEAFFRLHEIKCPMLFLTGERSNMNSKEWASLRQTRTQRGEWYEVPNCGHLVTMENPRQVACGIESFVYKHLVELKDIPTIPNNPSRIDKYTNNYIFHPKL